MATLSEHFLIGAFADYYQELVLAKNKISEGKLAEYLGMEAMEADHQLLGILHRKLKSKLTDQQQTIRANATSSEQLDYLKVLYACCALTDEQFLFDLNWGQAQSDKWQQEYLMEWAFFRSDCAGSKIFDNIDEILTDRSKINNRSDLAAVYLLSITLGFVGKYRGWDLPKNTHIEINELDAQSETSEQEGKPDISISEPGPLEREKEKLYRAMDKPMGQQYVFPQAYEHVLRVEEDMDKQRIAPLKRWYQYAAYSVLGYLLLSTLTWFSLTAGIGSEIDSLESAENCMEQISGAASVTAKNASKNTPKKAGSC